MGIDSEKHKYYRTSGETLVVILVTLSSGLLLWHANIFLESTKNSSLTILVFATIFLIADIIFSLLALLAHYKGYQSEARSNNNAPTTAEATKWFNRADWLVPRALYIFICGAILDIALLIILKFDVRI